MADATSGGEALPLPQMSGLDVLATLAAVGLAFISAVVARTVWGGDIVAFSPRWSWHLGQMYQVLVFPSICIAGAVTRVWAAPEGTSTYDALGHWLESGWDVEAGAYNGFSMFERVFIVRAAVESNRVRRAAAAAMLHMSRVTHGLLPSAKYVHVLTGGTSQYSLIAYLAKDFFFPLDSVMVLHHVVSIACGLASFYMTQGIGLFVATSTTFELGSCSLSFKQVKPSSWFRWELFIVMHTLSNLGVLFFTWWYYHLPGHAWIGWGLIVASIGLGLVRQYICTSDYVRNKAAALAAAHDKDE